MYCSQQFDGIKQSISYFLGSTDSPLVWSFTVMVEILHDGFVLLAWWWWSMRIDDPLTSIMLVVREVQTSRNGVIKISQNLVVIKVWLRVGQCSFSSRTTVGNYKGSTIMNSDRRAFIRLTTAVLQERQKYFKLFDLTFIYLEPAINQCSKLQRIFT